MPFTYPELILDWQTFLYRETNIQLCDEINSAELYYEVQRRHPQYVGPAHHQSLSIVLSLVKLLTLCIFTQLTFKIFRVWNDLKEETLKRVFLIIINYSLES
jgi:hypothetical protein